MIRNMARPMARPMARSLVVRPEELGGFLPTDISGMVIWLDAENIDGADDDLVDTWEDKASGYVYRGTTTQRPTLKTGILNGKPVVRFNGTANVLRDLTVAPSFRVPGDFTNTGIAYDASDDTLWIGCFDDGKLYHTTTTGVLLGAVQTPIGANSLQGVAYDPSDDSLWVVGRTEQEVFHIDKNGTEIESIATAFTPNGVAIDSSGDIWVCRTDATTIYRYDRATLAQASTISPATTNADGIAFNLSGKLLLTQDGSGGASAILTIEPTDGTTLATVNIPEIKSIEHLAVEPVTGNIYLCEDAIYHESKARGNRVFKLSPTGDKPGGLRNVAGHTIFSVHKWAAKPSSARVIASVSTGTATSTGRANILGSSGGKHQTAVRRLDSVGAASVVSAADITTDWVVVKTVTDLAARTLDQYINGTLDGTAASILTTGSTSDTQSLALSVGAAGSAASFANADIATLMVWNRVLTADEIVKVEAYIARQYATP